MLSLKLICGIKTLFIKGVFRVDENFKKEGKQLSVMEMFSKTQARLDPLPSAVRASDSMLRMAQYEQMSSAASIASKAFQQSSLMLGYFENQSSISRFAQSRAEEAVIFKDPSVDIMNMVNPYNSLISNITQNLAKTMTELADPMAELMKPLVGISQSVVVAADIYKQSDFVKEIYAISQSQELNNLTLKMSNAIKQINEISQLKSFEALSSFDNISFNDVLNTDLTQGDIEKFSKVSLNEIDSELSNEIKLGTDFALYSKKTQKLLVYLYHFYLLPVLLGLVTYHVLQAQEESKVLETKQEVRAFVRSPPSTFDRQALKGHRFTIVNLLNFRDKPSMNSNVVDSLPIGTTVRVVNKSDRSWLLVEVEINGELEVGWVLRRYTTYFK